MKPTLTEFLQRARPAGGLQTEDVLASFLPLARTIAQWHDRGQVAPPFGPEDLDVEADGALSLRHSDAAVARLNSAAVEALQQPKVSGLKIVGHGLVTHDDETGAEYENLDIAKAGDPISHPIYFTGYRAWEQQLDHHDAPVDIFLLGLTLATLALDLDFNDRTDVSTFIHHRNNLFTLNERLHPTLAAVIREMTALDRHERAADLRSVIQRLETYRDQPVGASVNSLPGFREAAIADRRTLVKTHLRDRLFEISRRNRLIYFRATQGTVNLTEASVPLVIQLGSIRREQLFVWQGALARDLSTCKTIALGKHLRFEDQPYLSGALDRVISQARHDRAEFGFSQLRLVIAFLHWHNLKEAPQERIVSPLLWLPVELTRKKGVKDHYTLEVTSSEAEINPALRHHLKQLYNLDLPETLDLAGSDLAAFHNTLQQQIKVTEPAVTLRLADAPQIELIHERARLRLAQFARKKLPRAPQRSTADFDYSYDYETYRPLGAQLFRDKVRPAPLPQRKAVGAPPPPAIPHMVTDAQQEKSHAEHSTFALTRDAGNPYLWDFDVCSITLGNFNYRKMSLVRDYSTLLAERSTCPTFDRVFSIEPRAVDSEPPPPLDMESEWPVVRGDATQRAAVALARTGRSFIVQGPPGTGKSQTITNLIADFIARQKRVLFVCEKRAAIDVVFHRLRQQGLEELCCLIHDSQTDKKSFVQNLKQTYETWLAQPDLADQIMAERTAVVKSMQQDAEQLQRFDTAMTSVPDYIGTTVRELLHTLVTLRASEPGLTPEEAERLPDYNIWKSHDELARRLSRTLNDVCQLDTLARHPFKMLSAQFLKSERPLEALYDLTGRTEAVLATIEPALSDTEQNDTLTQLEQIARFTQALVALVEHNQLALLDESSPLTQELKSTDARLLKLQQTLAETQTRTAFWREKLTPTDVEAALALAEAKERSFFRIFSSAWRRMKTTLEARYDFARHAVRPAFSQVLKELWAEQSAERTLNEARATGSARFNTDVGMLTHTVSDLKKQTESPRVEQLRAMLLSLSPSEAAQIVRRLAALAPHVQTLLTVLPNLLREGFRDLRSADLGELIRQLRSHDNVLPDLLPLLAELEDTDRNFSAALRHFALSPDGLASACARQSLERLYRTERWLPRFDGPALERYAARIGAAEQQWLEKNAAVIRAAVRRCFREHVQISTTSATQLEAEGKSFKKTYSSGRRELEHEFGKSMRFKSIRDLAAGDSGRVIRDLKPVWLMSPLSVSDTLPLDTQSFDAVIFDEASQIPVEEAVPALYRAPQVIVVGDEMQLPPTNFFAVKAPEHTEIEVEEQDERFSIALDADSLLTQSAKNLPAAVLSWHYRSRSESLIGFSNAAFYSGNLYTIPDRDLPASAQPALVVRDRADAAENVAALLARPLSFHWMQASPYENRRNPGEAAYIADLVRGLLEKKTPHSIGIVAFSEAQQTEIEEALSELANRNAEFSALLEEARLREQDDQFCGLFVKNLENVQGDERDIIVLSICYGPGPDGRMLMNFGPINQRGGEKRLNVIFSRARHHMAVVSSIRHQAITNDYNDGAAALKGFLQYAELMSGGDLRSARTVLEGLNVHTRRTTQLKTGADHIVQQLAGSLRERGYAVDEQVGQSRFRCDLAIRRPDQSQYRIALLIDTADFYANRNVVERNVTRPAILRSFGWEVMTVLSRDWYHEPNAVLDRIERRMRGE
jgi:hypothetical protein